nr:hypothetical protein VIGAN_07137500 [Ipomoea batatas]
MNYHSWRTFDATALAQNLICAFMSSADFLLAAAPLCSGAPKLFASHASDTSPLLLLTFSSSFTFNPNFFNPFNSSLSTLEWLLLILGTFAVCLGGRTLGWFKDPCLVRGLDWFKDPCLKTHSLHLEILPSLQNWAGMEPLTGCYATVLEFLDCSCLLNPVVAWLAGTESSSDLSRAPEDSKLSCLLDKDQSSISTFLVSHQASSQKTSFHPEALRALLSCHDS